ncbi:flagellar hook assembly protein FlgD [Pseudobutyrivibrio sp. MD2005]|uniref:flagellar hook assembly protein FlgD n=1 Tax=Pseudobutyrivibrio sp. MD2005 TaxID=1410616 RepID=UPI000480A60A|nr:flagellar hook capping FlgD N-terminal domain-containing protein [Pseudobutyrivibrio sp. MD2005]
MAGSLVGQIVNGEYKKTAASNDATKANSTTSTSKTASKEGTQYNEEMFLQLLVAEMQYQDPLEPTDNGQYVQQLASFTQIEAIQSVQSDMATIQANSLVGKVVIIDADNEEIHGVVDYVTTDDDGKMFASVDGKEYEIDDIKSVVNETYYNAVMTIDAFNTMVAKLPTTETVTLGDEKAITDVMNVYNAMDSYTQGFVSKETVDYIKALAAKFAELKKAKEESDNNNETVSETAATSNTNTNEETTESAEEETSEEVAPTETEGA